MAVAAQPRILLLSLGVVFLATFGFAAVVVEVNVDTALEGHAENIAVQDGFPQHIALSWYNTGSVGCNAQTRIQFSQDNTTVHTAWSEESSVWPGGSADWDITTALPNGIYNYSIDVLHCTAWFHLDEGTIQSTGKKTSDSSVTVLEQVTRDSTVTLYVKSETNTKNVYVVPTKYPQGWRISGTTTTFKNGINPIEFSYIPTIWTPTNITLSFVSEDGVLLGKQTIKLQKQRTIADRLHTAYVQVLSLFPPIFH